MTAAGLLPGETVVRRRVTASGVVWLGGQSYYISRRLAGRSIDLKVAAGKLVVDVAIPLHKEYSLPRPAQSSTLRARGWRSPRRVG